jgi:riboflavin kinase
LETDEHTYECIPDQIAGIYLGWVKSKVHGFSKVIICTGWDFSQQTVERVMVGASLIFVGVFIHEAVV